MKQKTGLLPVCSTIISRSPSGAAVLWLAIAAFSCGPFALAVEDQNKKELRPSETPEVTLSKEDTVESLSAALKGDREERLVAIRKLGMIETKESRVLLSEYYKSLPQSHPSTGSNQQKEKVIVARELVKKMELSERVPFLLDVLNAELNAMREAKKIEQDNYYPKGLTRTILSLLEEQGVTRDIRNRFNEYQRDQALPADMRADLLACTMLFDMQAKGIETDRDKVRLIVDKIVPRPILPIPWHIYTNQLARISYGKTKAVQAQRKEAGTWFRSDRGVENSAQEAFLSRFGLTSVMVLVEALADEKFDSEKKDYLTMLATEILRASLREGKNLPDEDKKVVVTIKKYLDNMKDEGAFSRRADVAANLNAIYAALRMTERVPVTPEDNIKLEGEGVSPTNKP